MTALLLQRPGTHEFETISLKVGGVLDGLGAGSGVMSIEAIADRDPPDADRLVVNLGATAPSHSRST